MSECDWEREREIGQREKKNIVLLFGCVCVCTCSKSHFYSSHFMFMFFCSLFVSRAFFVGFHFILFDTGLKHSVCLLHIFLHTQYYACFFLFEKKKNNTRICFFGNERSCQGQPLLFIYLEIYSVRELEFRNLFSSKENERATEITKT